MTSSRISRPLATGFTLMEMIGVMAIMSILAAVIAPSVFDAIDRTLGDAETTNVKQIMNSLEQAILESKRIPTQNINDWVSMVATYSSFARDQIEFNARGYRRRIYIDPRFFTTTDSTFPGYTQTSGLSAATVSPRILLVSDLTQNVPAPPGTHADFSAIWDQTPSASITEGKKVKIQRLHLAALFSRVVLLNANPQQPAYRIESGTAYPVPPAIGTVDGQLTRYILRQSNLNLLASPYPSGGLLTLATINSDQSFRFETNGSQWYWTRQ